MSTFRWNKNPIKFENFFFREKKTLTFYYRWYPLSPVISFGLFLWYWILVYIHQHHLFVCVCVCVCFVIIISVHEIYVIFFFRCLSLSNKNFISHRTEKNQGREMKNGNNKKKKRKIKSMKQDNVFQWCLKLMFQMISLPHTQSAYVYSRPRAKNLIFFSWNFTARDRTVRTIEGESDSDQIYCQHI